MSEIVKSLIDNEINRLLDAQSKNLKEGARIKKDFEDLVTQMELIDVDLKELENEKDRLFAEVVCVQDKRIDPLEVVDLRHSLIPAEKEVIDLIKSGNYDTLEISLGDEKISIKKCTDDEED